MECKSGHARSGSNFLDNPIQWKPLIRDDKWKALFEAKQRELEMEEGQPRKEGIIEIRTLDELAAEGLRSPPGAAVGGIYPMKSHILKDSSAKDQGDKVPVEMRGNSDAATAASSTAARSFEDSSDPPEPKASSNTVKMRFHTERGLIERRFLVDDTLETVNRFLANQGESDVQIVTYNSDAKKRRSFKSLSEDMAKMSLRELGLVGALAFAFPKKP